MALNLDLDEAMKIAVREIIDFITGKFSQLCARRPIDRQRGGRLSGHAGR